jgi:hypothetical protein
MKSGRVEGEGWSNRLETSRKRRGVRESSRALEGDTDSTEDRTLAEGQLGQSPGPDTESPIEVEGLKG